MSASVQPTPSTGECVIGPCRWILLGLAMVNEAFRDRFFVEIDPTVFSGNLEKSFHTKISIVDFAGALEVLGVKLKAGQKPHEAIMEAVQARADDYRWERVAMHVNAGRLQTAKDEAAELLGRGK
jgi:hypothetical protein